MGDFTAAVRVEALKLRRSRTPGIGGLFVFGLLFIWVFGREFADRTVKDMLALPVPRAAIVAAKFIVATAWCLILAAWTGALGVGVVTGLRLPGAAAGTVGSGLVRLLLTAIMTIALVAPFALLASVARGYLLVVLVGLAAVLGTGSWWRRADQTR